MERKLAHIEYISALSSIDGADKIEVALVLGWQCVVKKGEFSVGDKVVYVEVDSVMPERKEYEFLKDRKYRVRTIKLRGQISQGLVLPISSLPPKDYSIGQDVTDILGITKYLSPSERDELNQESRIKNEKNKLKKFMLRYSWFRRLFMSRKQKMGFPYWVSKTDEFRIQGNPSIISQFADRTVYVTEKIDYQSVTFTGKLLPRFEGLLGKILPKKYVFVVCSRNFTVSDKNSLYWRIAKKYNIEQILRENPTLTIQGEQGDTKIQGNKYGIKEPRFWVFNIIDHEKNYHFDCNEIFNFCYKNGLEMVPVVTITKLSAIGSNVQELVEYSKDNSVLADIPREGIVVRCIDDGKKVLSFKVINPEFMLKYDC